MVSKLNRRGFFRGLTGLVGGLALAESIPFNRVWSFPKKLVINQKPIALAFAEIPADGIFPRLGIAYYDETTLNTLKWNMFCNRMYDEAMKKNGKQVRLFEFIP